MEAGFNLLLEHSVCRRGERTTASTMAGLFRRLFGHAGHSHRKNEGAKKAAENVAEKVPKTTVKVPIPQERKVDPPVIRQIRLNPPPVVSKCTYGNGGVQVHFFLIYFDCISICLFKISWFPCWSLILSVFYHMEGTFQIFLLSNWGHDPFEPLLDLQLSFQSFHFINFCALFLGVSFELVRPSIQ